MDNKCNILTLIFKRMKLYNVIGIMSGTSLDGLDICYCTFSLSNTNEWSFKINCASTVKLDKQIKTKLSNAISFKGLDLALLNNQIGDYIGLSINNFISKQNIHKKDIDFVSSHGHTIFHQPEKKLTLQIGNGANISSITKLPVICDFRTSDLALNGHGAPLVPIGDKLLFSEYEYCLNLGGIANISFQDNERIAFDICPTNILFNNLAKQLGKEYDNNGDLSKSGNLNIDLLAELNNLEYYQLEPPKSLGYEWVEQNIFPILSTYNISTEDKLRTLTEHITEQISKYIKQGSKVLISGGGSYNTFLIERLKQISDGIIIIPSEEIIDFKEALLFAFLGVLRVRLESNCLKSVTGANQDNIGGSIYQSFK